MNQFHDCNFEEATDAVRFDDGRVAAHLDNGWYVTEGPVPVDTPLKDLSGFPTTDSEEAKIAMEVVCRAFMLANETIGIIRIREDDVE